MLWTKAPTPTHQSGCFNHALAESRIATGHTSPSPACLTSHRHQQRGDDVSAMSQQLRQSTMPQHSGLMTRLLRSHSRTHDDEPVHMGTPIDQAIFASQRRAMVLSNSFPVMC